MNEKIEKLLKKANALPLSPGVYIMKNKKKEIIYIGKAKALKNRVSQYFRSGKNHDLKVKKMVQNVDSFDYIITDSEFEALILESSLIKQHMPKYNILLKDDKGYSYFKITNEKYRRIEAVYKVEKDGAKYLGPYNSRFIVSQTAEEARKMFKIPGCKTVFNRKKAHRPCLNYHIGICMAPCAGKISFAEYDEAVNDAINFIKSGAAESIKQLTKKMNEYAENLDFERAAKLRDKILAVKRVKERQKVTYSAIKNQDVIACVMIENKICFEIFRFKDNRLYDSQHYILENLDDKEKVLSDFIVQYYEKNDIPAQITLSSNVEARESLQKLMISRRGGNVRIVVPMKGEQKKLAEMCENNATYHLSEKTKERFKNQKALSELTELLNLEDIPGRIEAYDISNTNGSENVGVMVVYKNGEKYRKGYRKFKIKSFIGQDDYRSLGEVIERRFAEYDKNEDESFRELPDLLLIDGGRGQLSAVSAVLERLNISIDTFGMVKDDRHRTRAIASSDGEVELKPTKSAFTFVTEIQDEVHRFAIEFHKNRRKQTSLESSLLSIEGVGEVRARNLFSHFKTFTAMKNASADEIASVKGIDRKTAENIANFFMQK